MAVNLKIPGVLKKYSGQREPVFLLMGHRGWVGGMITKLLRQQGKMLYHSKVRMEDRTGLAEELDRYKPTHVLNCAGVTGRPNVDWCEDNKEKTIRCNVVGCLNLVDLCFLRKIHVTNLATGCIFHYDKNTPMHKWSNDNWVNGGKFTEESAPNFD